MGSSRRSPRGRGMRPIAEGLEARNLMTNGAGAIFAVIPAVIGKAGGTVDVPFTVDPGHFSSTHGGMVLGIDISGYGTKAATPQIVSVKDAQGHVLPISHATYDAQVRPKVGGKTQGSAVLVTLDQPAHQHPHAATYTVQVAATGQTQGGVQVGFYLPGDANGDGVVDRKDIQAINSELGARVGDAKYNLGPDADTNRDGHITQADLAIARRNLGVKTTLIPALTGHPDPQTAVEPQHRTTAVQDLGFVGKATPGATVTADLIGNQPTEFKTTADSGGNYRLVLHLSPGLNSYVLTAADAFGQSNTGILPGITYVPPKS